MILSSDKINLIAKLFLEKKIGVLPTDTIYGIHSLAHSTLIAKLISIKGKELNSPVITLISDVSMIDEFDVKLDDFALLQIEKLWPGPNTLIFETSLGKERSFRLPRNQFLLDLIKKTGPLASTSANLHGHSHSKNVEQAINYFGDSVDFYVDGGTLDNLPSSVYKIFNNEITKIR
ncbi:L-threonylcarbamoyladenylate synthase [candidate division WWE3 bacterium]|nr:L-threonylcarbamoyladenylate synthase [candidate division WWE3 bacterium]